MVVIVVVFGVVMDVLENGVSFVMLVDFVGFVDWFVLLYFGFVVIKFVLIGFVLICVVVCLIIVVFGCVFKCLSFG